MSAELDVCDERTRLRRVANRSRLQISRRIPTPHSTPRRPSKSSVCQYATGAISDARSHATVVHRHPDLLKGIYDMGFSKPSKIQERALPLLLANP